MEILAVYKKGETSLQTTVYEKDGIQYGQYSNKPITEYIAEGFEVMPIDEAIKHIHQAETEAYIKPFKEVTAEEWDEALNCLPPEKWENFKGGSIFRMCEYLTGNLTAHYVQFGERFFCATRRTSTPYAVMIDEVSKLIA